MSQCHNPFYQHFLPFKKFHKRRSTTTPSSFLNNLPLLVNLCLSPNFFNIACSLCCFFVCLILSWSVLPYKTPPLRSCYCYLTKGTNSDKSNCHKNENTQFVMVHFAFHVWLQLFVETMFRILSRVFPKIETWVIFIFVCLIVFLKSKISVFRHIFRTSQHCILKTWINFETIKCTDIFYLLKNDNLGNVKN